MYMNMESIIITITTMIMNEAVDMIKKNMHMITKNMNIITMTPTMNAVADMIIMIITIIMLMKCSRAGALRLQSTSPRKALQQL